MRAARTPGVEVSLADGSVLTPSAEIGMRHDGGDAETGFGADIGAGIAWRDPKRGLAAELRGRRLLAHESKGFRERGLSGSLGWDPAPGGRGAAVLARSDHRRSVPGLSDAGREHSLGWRLSPTGRGGGGSLELSVKARRRESANDDNAPEHRAGARLTARF